MSNTPLRSFRIPDDIWNDARKASTQEGITLTAVVTGALEAFIADSRAIKLGDRLLSAAAKTAEAEGLSVRDVVEAKLQGLVVVPDDMAPACG